ncbi:hypothetical protein [Caulobacter sp. UNC279MFTsu5.1]|uniref:hypothetical protein n=1 Tax=Caulobacter sp. UNC279MFTsu5.1 TaxID=1502775 RepID=UPI00039DC6C9|nr:hypothetical protein [Caulobacter sp. UNC279MFTsu5.1]SFK06443.1 YD repeat-containing protein [Caulobacter sp. UNC279MFTsu5.1]
MILKMGRGRWDAFGALSRIAVSALAAATGFAAPAAARQALTPPDVVMVSPTGVSMTDTTFTYSTEDFSIGPFKLERSFYGGPERTKHYFGYGWTHNFDMWGYSMTIGAGGMNPTPTTKVVLGRKTHSFDSVSTANPTGDGYPSYGNEGHRMELQNGVMLFTDRDGVKYRFDSASDGKVTSVTSPNGDVFTLSYASGRLKTVFSNRGYALVFDYDGAGNVSAACGFNRAVAYVTTSTTCTSAAIKTSYGYTSGRLTSATSVTGAVASYQYNGWGGALSCLTDPGTSTCKYTLEYTPGGNNEVIKQTLADGSVWTFSCSCVYARGVGEEFQDDGTGWIDPSGNGKSFFLTNGMIKAYWDENSKQYETYFYGGQLSGVLLPEKNRWFANLSPRGIVSSNVYRPSKTGVSGYPDIVQDAKTFPSGDCTNRVTCNKPLTIADGNGNLTSFTYDQTHGGVLTETRPANSANVAAVVRHAYVQRTAWVKNASGGYSAEPAIWLPSEDRTCKTTATTGTTCAGGAADEIVTTYEYGPDSGPNNLLLRGKAVTADGITLRVCYAYDAQGNRIAETNARAGLASCP